MRDGEGDGSGKGGEGTARGMSHENILQNESPKYKHAYGQALGLEDPGWKWARVRLCASFTHAVRLTLSPTTSASLRHAL